MPSCYVFLILCIRDRQYYDCSYHDCCHSVVSGNANRHDNHVQRHVVCLEGVPRYVTTPEARSVFRGRAKIRDNSRGT